MRNVKESAQIAEEKILTKHPLGKSGRNISRQKYEAVKEAIKEVVKDAILDAEVQKNSAEGQK